VSVTTIDPSTARPLATYEETSAEELDGLSEFVNPHAVVVNAANGPVGDRNTASE
jgi:hypothetical protein